MAKFGSKSASSSLLLFIVYDIIRVICLLLFEFILKFEDDVRFIFRNFLFQAIAIYRSSDDADILYARKLIGKIERTSEFWVIRIHRINKTFFRHRFICYYKNQYIKKFNWKFISNRYSRSVCVHAVNVSICCISFSIYLVAICFYFMFFLLFYFFFFHLR